MFATFFKLVDTATPAHWIVYAIVAFVFGKWVSVRVPIGVFASKGYFERTTVSIFETKIAYAFIKLAFWVNNERI